MRIGLGWMVILLLAAPGWAENIAPAGELASPGQVAEQNRALAEENARLRMALERKDSDLRTMEYQVQQAAEELARAQQTIAMMRQEINDLAAAKPAAATAVARPRTAPAAATRPRAATSGRRHTVAAGETLAVIAARYYGAGASWQRIYDANRDRLASPQMIQSGMTLVIP